MTLLPLSFVEHVLVEVWMISARGRILYLLPEIVHTIQSPIVIVQVSTHYLIFICKVGFLLHLVYVLRDSS